MWIFLRMLRVEEVRAAGRKGLGGEDCDTCEMARRMGGQYQGDPHRKYPHRAKLEGTANNRQLQTGLTPAPQYPAQTGLKMTLGKLPKLH